MTQVFIAATRAEADLICQRLLGEGLNAVVQGDPLQAGGLSSVWVSEEDAERAHELIAELSRPAGDEPN